MKSKATNRILSLALAAVMLLGGVLAAPPMTAYAVNVGTPSLTHPAVNCDTGSVYYGGKLYRVMVTDGTNLTLFMDGSIGNMAYDSSNSKYWSGSDICLYLNNDSTGFLSTFSAPEKAAMVEHYGSTTESGPAMAINASQTIVLPSYDEVKGGGAWGMNDVSRNYSGETWWLRSPGMPTVFAAVVYGAGIVSGGGSLNGGVTSLNAVRPTFKLNRDFVIFTSAANDMSGNPKPTTAGSGLVGATSPTGEIKLTVKDSGQTLDIVTNTAGTTQSGATLEFGYQNATTGTNQYVSCVLVNQSTSAVGYYGKLADCETDGSDTLSISLSGVAAGTYTLKIFSEQDNGENNTDFCSTPVTMTVNVTGGSGTVSNFTGTVDNAKPGIVSVLPDGTDESTGGNIVITFNEPMNTATGTGTVALDNGIGTLTGTGAWSNGNQTYTVPYSGLAYTTSYTVTIAGFEDVAGNEMIEDDSYSFTTKDIPDGPDVDPPSLAITTGQSKTFTVSLGQSGNEAEEATVTSGDESVATVDTDFVATSGVTVAVTGVSQGSTDITVDFSGGSYNGGMGGTKTVRVTVSDPAPEPPEPPEPPGPPEPPEPPTPQPRSRDRSSGSGSGRQDTTRTDIPSTLVVDAAKAKAALAEREKSGANKARIRHNGEIKVLAEAWPVFGNVPVGFDTMSENVVQVRVTVREAGKMTGEKLLSGYVKGSAVDSRKAFFEKWFKNKMRVIHFDQQGAWGQPMEVAARVDLSGMDTANLYFYSYDKKTNSYKRIEKPAYWIDKNGYLHFTTEYAGHIVISEGLLERK